MEVKTVTKNSHMSKIKNVLNSKASFVPNIEVITKNVFVPVTKTIFTKKRNDAIQSNIPKRKTEFYKLCQSNNGITVSLLKKPCCLPTNISKHEVKMSKKRSHLIDKSYSFINDQSKEFSVRSQNKKQILVFPSSISDLPLTSFSKYQSFSNKNIAKSNKLKKNDKTNGKLSIDGINNILSNFSKTNNNKKLKLHKPKNVIYTSQYDSNRTKCFSPSSSEKISENNILNNSIISNDISNISLSTTAITTTMKNDRTEKQCFFDPYCDSVLRNVGVTIRDTISNTIINQREESQYPMKCIESNAFKEIRCSMFHPPTSDNFSETNETDIIENMHKKILSTRNFENNSRENIDYSILSFLTKNRSRLQNDTDLHKNDHHSCKIKYSWQVIGTGSQTSQTLLDSLVKENTLVDDEPICNCSIKYSWQIIGIATQTAPSDFTTSECRSAISLL